MNLLVALSAWAVLAVLGAVLLAAVLATSDGSGRAERHRARGLLQAGADAAADPSRADAARRSGEHEEAHC